MEIRYCKVYENGVLSAEEPYEVSDEQLYQEQLAREFNDAHQKAILALKNWDDLDDDQKDIIFKHLLKWSLWKDGWLKLDVL